MQLLFIIFYLSVCFAQKSVEYANTCVVQNTYVVYDDFNPTGDIEILDVTKNRYWYRQASVDEQQHDHNHHTIPKHANQTHIVIGHELNFPPMHARYPAHSEAKKQHEFVGTLLVIYSPWTMNLAETFNNVATALYRNKEVYKNYTIAMYTPESLPLEPFNIWMIKPFANKPPKSLSELSALNLKDNCFERVIVSNFDAGGYNLFYETGNYIKQKLFPQLGAPQGGLRPLHPGAPPAQAQATEGCAEGAPFCKTFPGAKDLRSKSVAEEKSLVILENRPNSAMRQFFGVAEFLSECNKFYKCIEHTFGNIQKDIEIMDSADVLVCFHGAGETNSVFMRRHSSIIEIGGKDIAKLWWRNFWWPMIALQTNFDFFYWSLTIKDAHLNHNSELEDLGLQTDPTMNARDRSVTLVFNLVHPILKTIESVGRTREKYAAIHGEKGYNISYIAENGVLTKDIPIWCSDTCGKIASPECRPC